MVDIEIRQAGPGELPLLMEWRMRVLREVFALAGDADLSALRSANEAYYRTALPGGTHEACFAVDAADGGRVVGCGGICYQTEMPSPDNPAGTNGYLMNIYVLPAMRRRGIARRIVDFLVAAAKRRGAGKIYLESTAAAQTLYRKAGFAELPGFMKLERKEQEDERN